MKRVVALTLAGVAFLAAADAQAVEFGTPATEHPFRSPQNFAFELRFSPYSPQIDSESGLTGTPFANDFGTKPRLSAGLEFDWQALRIPHFGTLGAGFGAAFVTMSRSVSTITGRTSGDETSLSIYPFTLLAVLRADVLWRELGAPIVPYAKLGPAVALWRASNSGGTSSNDNISGKGTSWGTDVALGGAFALDALDRGASQNMDLATGINNTYLYVEVYWLTLDGIAQKHALHVGTNTWSMGLTFEF
jgi:hypothetical protein